MAFLYYKDTLETVTMQRTQQFSAFVCYEKLRPIALAATSRFLTMQSLEFQEIWQKDSLETTWIIYHEKFELWLREFLIVPKTINGELRKSPTSKFY